MGEWMDDIWMDGWVIKCVMDGRMIYGWLVGWMVDVCVYVYGWMDDDWIDG